MDGWTGGLETGGRIRAGRVRGAGAGSQRSPGLGIRDANTKTPDVVVVRY